MTDEKEDIEFEAINEPWSRYKLADGTILELKLILTNLWVASKDQSGNPLYEWKFNAVGRINNISKKIMS